MINISNNQFSIKIFSHYKSSKYVRVVFLYCAIIFATSCSESPKSLDDKSSEEQLIEISFENASNEKTNLRKIISRHKIINLETTKECFLSSIYKVRAHHDKYVVFDPVADNICVFDEKGEFLNKIGIRGHGPGEYIDIVDFEMDTTRNRVLALSVEKSSLYEYNMKGEHINTIKLPFQASIFTMVDDEYLAFFIPYYDDNNKSFYMTNLKGDVVFSDFEFPESTFPFDFIQVTGGIKSNDEGGLYSEPSSSYIYQIKSTGDIYKKYYIDLGDGTWPEDRKYETWEFFETIQNGKANFLGNLYEENMNVLAFTYNLKLSSKVKNLRKRKAFYFKNSGTLISQDHQLEEDLLIKLISGPVGMAGSKSFISFILPQDVIRLMSEHISETSNNLCDLKNCIFCKLNDSVDINDNPVLFVYEFN